MKAKFLAFALTLTLIMSLAVVAPATASSDEARIRSLIKNFMGLLAKGDFAGAAKFKIRKLRPPPKGSLRYRMITKLAGALTKVGDVQIKGNRATAVMHFDPTVVKDVVTQIYAEQLERVKKIQDPKRRAAVLERLQKNKDKSIARRIKSLTRSRMRLEKKDGRWMIR